MLGAPGYDPLRQRRADARQTCDLAHVGAIQIDPLTGEQRTGELGGAAGGLAQSGATRGSRGLELDVAGGGSGSGREDETNPGAG